MSLGDHRREYHRRVLHEIVRISRDSKRAIEYPNFADSGNRASIAIAWEIVRSIGHEIGVEPIKGQTSGGRFEEITRDFLQATFNQLQHIGILNEKCHRMAAGRRAIYGDVSATA